MMVVSVVGAEPVSGLLMLRSSYPRRRLFSMPLIPVLGIVLRMPLESLHHVDVILRRLKKPHLLSVNRPADHLVEFVLFIRQMVREFVNSSNQGFGSLLAAAVHGDFVVSVDVVPDGLRIQSRRQMRVLGWIRRREVFDLRWIRVTSWVHGLDDISPVHGTLVPVVPVWRPFRVDVPVKPLLALLFDVCHE